MAARSFGPATLGVLLLLWAMIVATIIRLGLHLPAVNGAAFRAGYLHFTLSGFARILALMTGVEVFANLVAAYQGTASERSRKAFGSLTIIMSTTLLTMVIVGPAILKTSDPFNSQVSVFTQTMDKLLPRPLSYAGTLAGVIVLGSAAASAQGLQNLALGMRYRRYIPGILGRTNRYEVPDCPVWIEAGIASLCYLIFGTRDETYLTLYAAGVFVLLSMTGWAALKRLVREHWEAMSIRAVSSIGGVLLAAFLTTSAAIIIFAERFREGVWAYFLLIPALYLAFGYTRSRLGPPTPLDEHLGRFYSGQYLLPYQRYGRPEHDSDFESIKVVLDGSALAEHALPIAQLLAKSFGVAVRLAPRKNTAPATPELAEYLDTTAWQLRHAGVDANVENEGSPETGLVIMAEQPGSLLERFHDGAMGFRHIAMPALLIRPLNGWRSRTTRFSRLLVCLDGSEDAEQVLRYARAFANRLRSELLLLAVPEFEKEAARLRDYLESVATALRGLGITTRLLVMGFGPARTIVEVARLERADLILIANSGRGGANRRPGMGTVTEEIMRAAPCPLLVIPAQTR